MSVVSVAGIGSCTDESAFAPLYRVGASEALSRPPDAASLEGDPIETCGVSLFGDLGSELSYPYLLRTPLSREEIERHYEDELVEDGWRPDPRRPGSMTRGPDGEGGVTVYFTEYDRSRGVPGFTLHLWQEGALC